MGGILEHWHVPIPINGQLVTYAVDTDTDMDTITLASGDPGGLFPGTASIESLLTQ